MTKWDCECRPAYDEDDEDIEMGGMCDTCTISCTGNPKGSYCPRSGDEIYKTRISRDPDDYDPTFQMSNRAGVRWASGIYEALFAAQSTSGELICGICSTAIDIDDNGKISYTSKSGTLHVERPPIDHFGPDWRDRLAMVEKSTAYATADIGGKQRLLNAAFNAKPLRISHRSCNLARKKA